MDEEVINLEPTPQKTIDEQYSELKLFEKLISIALLIGEMIIIALILR